MNQSDLLTQIGYRIRTSSRNFVTNDEIKSYLNRSIDRLSSMVYVYKNTQTITLTSTQTTVALNADFAETISLYDNTNKIRYKKVSADTISSTAANDNYNYCISGSNIIINSASASGTLVLTYYSTYDCKTAVGVAHKGLSSGTDYPILDTQYQDYFVEDVSALIFRKERKYDDYKIAKSEANNILEEIYEEYPDESEAVYEQILTYGDIENFN